MIEWKKNWTSHTLNCIPEKSMILNDFPWWVVNLGRFILYMSKMSLNGVKIGWRGWFGALFLKTYKRYMYTMFLTQIFGTYFHKVIENHGFNQYGWNTKNKIVFWNYIKNALSIFFCILLVAVKMICTKKRAGMYMHLELFSRSWKRL